MESFSPGGVFPPSPPAPSIDLTVALSTEKGDRRVSRDQEAWWKSRKAGPGCEFETDRG